MFGSANGFALSKKMFDAIVSESPPVIILKPKTVDAFGGFTRDE